MRLPRAAWLAAVPLLVPVVLTTVPGRAAADGTSPSITATTPAYTGSRFDIGFSLADPDGAIRSIDVVVNGKTSVTIPESQLPSYSTGTGYADTGLSNLADGVVATITVDGRDSNGNIVATSPAVMTTSDKVAPEVALDLSNLTSQDNPTAVIRFLASDAHLTSVTCSIDEGTRLPCDGVATFTGVGVGMHTVGIFAEDAAGNVGGQDFTFYNGQPEAGIVGSLPFKLLAGTHQILRLSAVSSAIPVLTPTGTVSVLEGGHVIGVATLSPGAVAGTAVGQIPLTIGKAPALDLAYRYSGDANEPGSLELTEFEVVDPSAVVVTRTRVLRGGLRFSLACPKYAYTANCAGTLTADHHSVRYSLQRGRSGAVSVPVDAATILLAQSRHAALVTLQDVSRRTLKVKVA